MPKSNASAELLRQAAMQARTEAAIEQSIAPNLVKAYGDDCGTGLSSRRHLAVADWLEHEADRIDYASTDAHPDFTLTPGEQRHARSVACAYLGGTA